MPAHNPGRIVVELESAIEVDLLHPVHPMPVKPLEKSISGRPFQCVGSR